MADDFMDDRGRETGAFDSGSRPPVLVQSPGH